jgi:hypothetical protein
MVGPDVAEVLTRETARDPASWNVVCLNCGSPLDGRFCAHCGQRAVPPHPTVRQLAGDTWSELSGWDGRLARTVATLFRHPGSLTRALLEGQRVRYVSPVRLYLICSLLYFLVAAAAPVPLDEAEFEVGAGIGWSNSGVVDADEAAFGKAVREGLASLTPEERTAAEREIADQPAVFQPLLREMAEDYLGMRRRVTEVMPRALFVLIPLLAVILALFHRGRPYPDHLYFAVHLQAFVFVALALVTIPQFTGSVLAIAVAQLSVGLWLAAYVVIAQRRVYGGSWPASIFKTLGVGVIYMVLWGCTSIAATLWALRAA